MTIHGARTECSSNFNDAKNIGASIDGIYFINFCSLITKLKSQNS